MLIYGKYSGKIDGMDITTASSNAISNIMHINDSHSDHEDDENDDDHYDGNDDESSDRSDDIYLDDIDIYLKINTNININDNDAKMDIWSSLLHSNVNVNSIGDPKLLTIGFLNDEDETDANG